MHSSPIYDITPHTLVDYEGKNASVIWFAGCPLRCIYCHNPHIVNANGTISEEDALSFLRGRRDWTDGVVLSGGECCMYDGLARFCKKLKKMGLSVKMDTSGARPKRAVDIAKSGLIDTIALDFKATKEMFEAVAGVGAFGLFEKTLKGLLEIKFDFSVRTTVYVEYFDEHIVSCMSDILYYAGYRGVYTIQKAITSIPTLGALPQSCKVFQPSLVKSKLETRFIGF